MFYLSSVGYSPKITRKIQEILDITFNYLCYSRALELLQECGAGGLGPAEQQGRLQLARHLYRLVRFEHRLPEFTDWDDFTERLTPRYEQTSAFQHTFSKYPLMRMAFGDPLAGQGFMAVRRLLDHEQVRKAVPVMALRYLDMIYYKLGAEEFNMEMTLFLSEFLQHLEGDVAFLLELIRPLAKILAFKQSESE